VAKCESERVQAVCANVSFDCAPLSVAFADYMTWAADRGLRYKRGFDYTPSCPSPHFHSLLPTSAVLFSPSSRFAQTTLVAVCYFYMQAHKHISE